MIGAITSSKKVFLILNICNVIEPSRLDHIHSKLSISLPCSLWTVNKEKKMKPKEKCSFVTCWLVLVSAVYSFLEHPISSCCHRFYSVVFSANSD